MELFWAMFIFFMVITAIFIAIAFMFPEWVGITGKAALEIQKHQRGDDHEASVEAKSSDPAASTKDTN